MTRRQNETPATPLPDAHFSLTEEEATAAIGFISACEEWGLKDENLLSVADRLDEQMAAQKGAEKCDVCGGTGWIEDAE